MGQTCEERHAAPCRMPCWPHCHAGRIATLLPFPVLVSMMCKSADVLDHSHGFGGCIGRGATAWPWVDEKLEKVLH
jgi:hypothetical protein